MLDSETELLDESIFLKEPDSHIILLVIPPREILHSDPVFTARTFECPC